MSDASGIATKIVAISVVVMIVAAILAVTLAPPPTSNPDISTYVGLNDGDSFNYTISGVFNGTVVTGILNASFAQKDVSYWPIHTTSGELNAILISWSSSRALQMGVCNLMTPFGMKQVVWTFNAWTTLAGLPMTTISYIGVNPNVIYAFALNAPSFHLLLTLDHTNNELVKTGNTNAINWHNPNTSPAVPTSGGSTMNATWGTESQWFYAPNGGHLYYNLTGDKIDFWAFSESNLRSMADGGPFAYNTDISRWGGSSETGEAAIQPGLFLFVFSTHGAGTAHYTYNVV